MNDAAGAYKETHVHFKLRPRYKRPVKIGERTFSDDGFATKFITPHQIGHQTLYLISQNIEEALFIE